MSEPHSGNVNVSEPHSVNVYVSEPHSGNINVSEPTVDCCVTVCVYSVGYVLGVHTLNIHKLLWWVKLAKRHKM